MLSYNESSLKTSNLDELGLRVHDDDKNITSWFKPEYEGEYLDSVESVASKSAEANIHAWTPAYDNMDGGEAFWKMYELSRLTDDEKEQLPYEMNQRDTVNG